MFLFIHILVFPAFTTSKSNILQQAKENKLYEDEYWHVLLHYKKNLFNHYESIIDDPAFFLSEEGKKNPQAELEATINAFFEPVQEKQNHPINRFPARYKWLKTKLNLTDDDFPLKNENEYSALKEILNPKQISVIFPSGYMKNPASMFGHTFLLFTGEDDTKLLGQTVNYGVETDDPKGLVYMIKGLFGAYPGYFSHREYYKQIAKYTNTDMRDIWEYKLNLTEEQIDLFTRHFIELDNIYCKYYFISENCSYCLLLLLDAAVPDCHLTDKIGKIVEPVDTIKLLEKEGLCSEQIFRPSLYTKLQAEKSILTTNQVKDARNVALGYETIEQLQEKNYSEKELADIYNLCLDYIKYRANNNKKNKQDNKKLNLSLLKARSQLPKDAATELNIEVPAAPHKSHADSKIQLDYGHDTEGNYVDLGYKLVSHNLMDCERGLNKNFDLSFFMIDGKYNFTQNKFSLEKLSFCDILSLPASDSYTLNSAYEVKIGMETNLNSQLEKDLAGRLKFSLGSGFSPRKNSLFYFLGGTDLYLSPVYNYWTKVYLGGHAGYIQSVSNDVWKQHLYISAYVNPFDVNNTVLAAGITERIAVCTNCTILADYSYNFDYGEFFHKYSLSANFDF